MPVRVSSSRLLDKRQVEPLTAIARSAQLHGSDEQDNKATTVNKPKQLYVQEEQERKRVFYAGQIMTSNVKTLRIDMRFDDAWSHFVSLRYRHFPVLNMEQHLVGMLSDRDMLAYAASGKTHKITIDKLMTGPVLSATANTAIREVCQVMFNQHIGALPIVEENGELLGMITRSDILRSMIKHGPMELWV